MYNRWPIHFLLLGGSLVLTGCEGARSAPRQGPVASAIVPQVHLREPEDASPAERTVSRNIDSDYDADGIADHRIVISETFDASGNLVRRTEEEDFEADGIFDARTVTNFGG